MNQFLEQVEEFHQAFNHPISAGETASLKTRQLRVKLLFEELKELAEASDVRLTFLQLCHTGANDPSEAVDGNNVNRVEQLDAFCDLQYVLAGAILTEGLQFNFDAAFSLTHQNNMTKLHHNVEHAEETARLAGLEEGYSIVGIQTSFGDRYALVNSSGKTVKPHDHVKVKLESFI